MRIIEKENSFHQKEKINDWKDLKIIELQNELTLRESELSKLNAENTKLMTETEHLRRENKIISSSREKLMINISVERRENVLLKEQISAEKKRRVKKKNEDILSLRKSSLSALRSTLSMLR